MSSLEEIFSILGGKSEHSLKEKESSGARTLASQSTQLLGDSAVLVCECKYLNLVYCRSRFTTLHLVHVCACTSAHLNAGVLCDVEMRCRQHGMSVSCVPQTSKCAPPCYAHTHTLCTHPHAMHTPTYPPTHAHTTPMHTHIPHTTHIPFTPFE